MYEPATPIRKPALDPVTQRDEWLATRREGLGGSDAPSLFGCTTWMSPYTLYLDKIGQLPEREGHSGLEMGRELEPYTRRLYTRETGRVITDCQDRFIHPDYPWMLGTTDGTIVPFERRPTPGNFEGKTVGQYKKKDWADGPPMYPVVQCHHYMVVQGLSWGSIAAVVFGERDPLLWADVELDVEFAEMVIEAEKRFWFDHVLARRPPEVDAHPATTAALKALHPHDSGLMVDLPPEATAWREELDVVAEQTKALEARKDLAQNRLRNVLGAATYGMLPDGSGWSYKTVERRRHTVKPSTHRQLRTVSAKSMDRYKREAEATLKGLKR